MYDTSYIPNEKFDLIKISVLGDIKKISKESKISKMYKTFNLHNNYHELLENKKIKIIVKQRISLRRMFSFIMNFSFFFFLEISQYGKFLNISGISEFAKFYNFAYFSISKISEFRNFVNGKFCATS